MIIGLKYYEYGLRYYNDLGRIELIGFFSDYDNLLGECTASSGSDCTVGDAFNGDAASVFGVEAMLSADLLETAYLSVPVTFNYTYIDSEFDTDIADTDFFGDVSKGDPIPYIPEHQFSVNLGVNGSNWSVNISANYVDEVCVRASCNVLERTDSSLTVDLAGSYDLSSSMVVFGKVENLLDEDSIMGRHPYGARPNKDRTATIGVRFSF